MAHRRLLVVLDVEHGTYGVEQLAARHSNCFLFNYVQESTQGSLVYPVLLCHVIRVSYAVRRPCSDFMDMLRRLTSCRIIIIIIIIRTLDTRSVSTGVARFWHVIMLMLISADSVGAMVRSPPRPNGCEIDKVAPSGILLSRRCTQPKHTVKNTNVPFIMKVKKLR